MAIQDIDKIDFMFESADKSTLRLLMLEDREWEASVTQLEQLENKVSAYYNYIVSGQLLGVRPDADKKKIVVELHCQFMPPDNVVNLFTQISALYSRIGVLFTACLVRPVAEGGTIPFYPLKIT